MAASSLARPAGTGNPAFSEEPTGATKTKVLLGALVVLLGLGLLGLSKSLAGRVVGGVVVGGVVVASPLVALGYQVYKAKKDSKKMEE